MPWRESSWQHVTRLFCAGAASGRLEGALAALRAEFPESKVSSHLLCRIETACTCRVNLDNA